MKNSYVILDPHEAIDEHVAGGVEVRPEVAKFAIEMERILKVNDYKGGWKEGGYNTLGFFRDKLREECHEVQHELRRSALRPAAILRECADVANIAMMIADNWGELLK